MKAKPVRPGPVEGPARTRAVVAVAVSGGRDSMALLHCTQRTAGELGVDVMALHVHHGLQAAADGWAAHVEQACRRWGAGFAMQRLVGAPGSGQSIEAWARQRRYEALTAMAQRAGAGLVLLAQHRRDQAETFLLQALRGGGPAGLSAMPSRIERDGIVWARPWLALPAESIDTYVRRHRIRFVEDPSNADARFARSRLRTAVMPVLRMAFPDAESALTAAARRSAEAQALLDEIAQADLTQLVDRDMLRLAPWRSMNPARRANVLRAWLRARLGRGVPQSLLDRLIDELPAVEPAQWPFGDWTLRRYRGRLSAFQGRGRAGHIAPGEGGPPPELRCQPVEEGGVALDDLLDAHWKPREGGERFQRRVGTPPRSLKKQFQEAGVPAWQRNVPLLVAADGRLLFVPGLGIDARALAAPGVAQCALNWRPGHGTGPEAGDGGH